jgi:hypothetical protein
MGSSSLPRSLTKGGRRTIKGDPEIDALKQLNGGDDENWNLMNVDTTDVTINCIT